MLDFPIVGKLHYRLLLVERRNKVDISFIIPMINEYPAILHTVNSIQIEMAEKNYEYEIIVVENGKIHEYTDNFLKGYRIPIQRELIRYAFEEVQCGPAARQKGAEMAYGDKIMFMDAHTNLGRNTIAPMIKAFDLLDAGIIHGSVVKTHWVKPSERGLHYCFCG